MADQLPDRPGPSEDPWLTVQQVSEELKIHPATVRAWVKSGRLAAVRVGRTWRVRRSDVDRALMLDASPAYLRQEEESTREPDTVLVPQPAPRQIADHIMTVTRLPGAES
jgi:excisionase family DNA binding protein